MKKISLTEATCLALEGKLLKENSVEDYRKKLNDIRAEYNNIDRSLPSYLYKDKYNDIVKREKAALKDLKKAVAEEKGTFITPTQLTNAIKKLADMQKYADQTTGVRGFHWYSKGDFEVNTDEFNKVVAEDALYYDVYFYGKESKEKADQVFEILNNNGYNVERTNNGLRVACYK